MRRMLIRFLNIFSCDTEAAAGSGPQERRSSYCESLADYEKSFWEAFNAVTSTNDIRNFEVLPGKNAWEDAILLQIGSRTKNMRQKTIIENEDQSLF